MKRLRPRKTNARLRLCKVHSALIAGRLGLRLLLSAGRGRLNSCRGSPFPGGGSKGGRTQRRIHELVCGGGGMYSYHFSLRENNTQIVFISPRTRVKKGKCWDCTFPPTKTRKTWDIRAGSARSVSATTRDFNKFQMVGKMFDSFSFSCNFAG